MSNAKKRGQSRVDWSRFAESFLWQRKNRDRILKSGGCPPAGDYRIVKMAGSSIMMGVDHVRPSLRLQELKKCVAKYSAV